MRETSKMKGIRQKRLTREDKVEARESKPTDDDFDGLEFIIEALSDEEVDETTDD